MRTGIEIIGIGILVTATVTRTQNHLFGKQTPNHWPNWFKELEDTKV